MTYPYEDFDRLSLHDCHIWGIEFRVGDPDDGDWTSDLTFDVDFIANESIGVASCFVHAGRAATPVLSPFPLITSR